MTTAIQGQIAKLVKRLHGLNNEYFLMEFDEECPQQLGVACTEAQLRDVRNLLGIPIPPSYDAFLSQFNGWTNFSGGADLLSSDAQTSAWATKRRQELRDLLVEFGDPQILDTAFIIMMGTDQMDFAYLNTASDEEELEVIHYDVRELEEVERYSSFQSFLEGFTKDVQDDIDDDGDDDDDDDDDE